MEIKLLTEQVKSDKITIVDFYSDWCRPCVNLMPVLKKIEEEFSETVQVLKINVDENKEYVYDNNYSVRGIPRLMIYRNGEQLNDNYKGRTYSQITETLNQLTKNV